MNINQIKAGSIITKSKLPDADYVINPYIGCNHGCIYCYAEFMSRFTGHGNEKWGDFMDIKDGYPMPRLEKFEGKSILFGSVTDPYNPLEKKYQKTRELLKVFAESGVKARAEILTKSALVRRDLDLLTRIPNIRVGISLSATDAKFARVIESHAPSPQERIETMRILSEAGITVYAFISPIFPFFSDWKAVASEAGKYADEICFENLNLRGGYKKRVLDIIKEEYPEKYNDFEKIYSSKEIFQTFWENEAKVIKKFMKGKKYKIYFFHEKIKKA
ncbi:radical SAM protein [Leadbettera azotonutricia]|uniref:Radical SAM domain protein protein n=1 Tax=Leadbettera azotonutricia (strain ATCC BAA-888 / DSM 13862 / ZAS-9) TaxID=545695 RepID=F5YD16_LEAAZ|nr:radical SAM protein [Leadbettera azotonutricia]AEF82949.1 radical SAM domain protein protein [Leadbettera azotonutricia ZAS-9]